VSASGRSRRAWGWHRLADEWAAGVVADADVRPGGLVLDIGAGDGALTSHLLGAGARVLAVELHSGRARRLRERFGAAITVVEGDVRSLRLPRRPFRVVACPPYGLSGELLRLLLAPGSQMIAADLLLQRAVVRRHAERGAAASGGRSRGWSMRAGRPVPRRAFQPPPKVDSAVLVVRRRHPLRPPGGKPRR
jgi:23S rRNA (adenine-N6)-dimethyltransferase